MNELNGMTKMTMDDKEEGVEGFAPYSREDLTLFCKTMSKMFDDKSIIHYLADILVNGYLLEGDNGDYGTDGRGAHHNGLVRLVSERGYTRPKVKTGFLSEIRWCDWRTTRQSVLNGSEEKPYESKSGLTFFDIFNFKPLQNKIRKDAIDLRYDYAAKIEEYKNSNSGLYEYYKPLADSCLLVTKFIEARKGPGLFGFAHKEYIFRTGFSPLLADLIKEAKNIIAKDYDSYDASIGVSTNDSSRIIKEEKEFTISQEAYKKYKIPTRTELTFQLL